MKSKGRLLFVDLEKAFDKVDRHRLPRALQERCRDDQDRHLVALIRSLLSNTKALFGEHLVETTTGVPQGGVLSPLLFNLYMEEALKTQEHLWRAATSQRLLAYADDLVIQGKDLAEIEEFIVELERLDEDWSLTVNHAKSEVLAVNDKDVTIVRRIKQVPLVRYLGVTIAQDNKLIVSNNKAAAFKYLGYIKSRLRSTSLDVKAALAQAYSKSLLLYFGVPLLAADLLKPAQVEAWEKEALRQLHLLPCDLKRSAIVNLTELSRPLTELLKERTEAVRRASDNQQRLSFPRSERQMADRTPKPPRTYIPRILAS
jgi:hypothetical protein